MSHKKKKTTGKKRKTGMQRGNFIQSGTLQKLAVKELNKYTECHDLHGVYIRINEKAN